ncbi:MAG: glycosyltransferase [Nitrospiraceae bacterium]|nr:MAG: glycosyltransferase [Nitrospiraceae bacterium]
MNLKKKKDIQLVITFALKKEVPVNFFDSHGVPVYTLAALKSGVLRQRHQAGIGILAVVTGSGLQASEEAAMWIRDNISPCFVINVGTCGVTSRAYELGRWIRPERVVNESGEALEMDVRSPVQDIDAALNVSSLISIKKHAADMSQRWNMYDAVDMECFAQAKVFEATDTSFHTLKFSTDYADSHTDNDFNRHLHLFEKAASRYFSFLDDRIKNVAVVIPVYNRKETVSRAIDSVLDQSLAPEEIIIVNDGSDDGTADVLERYGKNITCIDLLQNSGPSAARNRGLKHAKSEWIAFLDSDDYWEKDKLEKQRKYLERYPFYQIMQSEEIWIRKGKRVNPCRHHEKKKGWIWEHSLQRCLVSPSGVLLKKSLLEQYGGFDERLPVCEDYDLWLKISRDHPVGLDNTLSVIKSGGHEDQLSLKFPAMDRFRVTSLLGMLESEQVPCFREKIVDVLNRKLSILVQGCQKRRKYLEAEEYQSIMDSLRV